MVEIINYQPSGGAPSAPAKGGHASAGGYGGEYGYVEIDYGSMAGAQMAAPEPAGPPQSFGPYGSVYSGPSSSVYAPAAQLPMDAGMYGSGYAAVPDYNQVAPGYHQHPAHAAAPAAEYGAASGGAGMMAPGHSLMDAVTAPQGPPPAPSTPWQVHYAADGRPYYYNSSTGITTWEAPAHGV